MSFAGNKIPAKTQNVIDGKFLDSSTSQWVDVHNPATNDVVTKTPCTTHEEMNAAVESAKVAFKSWSKTSPLQRQGTKSLIMNLNDRSLKLIAFHSFQQLCSSIKNLSKSI